jgi:hypothetical protein
MMPITLMSLLLLLFGEVTPRPINCVFIFAALTGRMHDSFFYQTLHINCTKRRLPIASLPLAAQQLTDVASRLGPHLTCDHRRLLQEWQQ